MARHGRIAAFAAAMVLGASGVSAQSAIDGSDPQAILDLARGFGSAALETDPVGDPLLQGRIDGNVYSVYFYGCEKNAGCDTILFSAIWDVESSSLDAVNDFNKNAIFGRAYVDDEGDYVVEITVNLAHGVSRANLDDTFVVWSDLMREFADFAANN
ncbi:YbjN domain-containing protein [Salinarimonas sp.]|uniref:YbjN domain-containing protein n=1 Tax=Salinarimonas sp. TaxID=2766526 RepID=UPI0032D918A3